MNKAKLLLLIGIFAAPIAAYATPIVITLDYRRLDASFNGVFQDIGATTLTIRANTNAPDLDPDGSRSSYAATASVTAPSLGIQDVEILGPVFLALFGNDAIGIINSADLGARTWGWWSDFGDPFNLSQPFDLASFPVPSSFEKFETEFATTFNGGSAINLANGDQFDAGLVGDINFWYGALVTIDLDDTATSVPVGPTLPLLAFALLGVGLARRRR